MSCTCFPSGVRLKKNETYEHMRIRVFFGENWKVRGCGYMHQARLIIEAMILSKCLISRFILQLVCKIDVKENSCFEMTLFRLLKLLNFGNRLET